MAHAYRKAGKSGRDIVIPRTDNAATGVRFSIQTNKVAKGDQSKLGEEHVTGAINQTRYVIDVRGQGHRCKALHKVENGV